MKDVDVKAAFNDYWNEHFEKLVLPVSQKNEIKKIAFHAYHEGFRKQTELCAETPAFSDSQEEAGQA